MLLSQRACRCPGMFQWHRFDQSKHFFLWPMYKSSPPLFDQNLVVNFATYTRVYMVLMMLLLVAGEHDNTWLPTRRVADENGSSGWRRFPKTLVHPRQPTTYVLWGPAGIYSDVSHKSLQQLPFSALTLVGPQPNKTYPWRFCSFIVAASTIWNSFPPALWCDVSMTFQSLQKTGLFNKNRR